MSVSQVVGHIKRALSGANTTAPSFALIVGSEFSRGLVPLTSEMMRSGFRLPNRKQRCDRHLEAVCHLQTHQFGWEIVLTVNNPLQHSQVCRSPHEILDTTDR
jgi:hypothetical protein